MSKTCGTCLLISDLHSVPMLLVNVVKRIFEAKFSCCINLFSNAFTVTVQQQFNLAKHHKIKVITVQHGIKTTQCLDKCQSELVCMSSKT